MKMEEDELSFLIESRGRIRAKVTTKTDNLVNRLEELAPQDRSDLKVDLLHLQEKLEKANKEISRGIWSKDKTIIAREIEKCEEYEDKVVNAIKLLDKRNDLRGLVHVPNQFKLPHVSLPEFNNRDKNDLAHFISNFESITSKFVLTEYEKFNYLKQQLSNEPLQLIENLHGTNQSFTEAKSLLEKAFASPVKQKYDAIRKLSQLSLKFHGDPYAFVSEMRTIKHSIISLNIDVNMMLNMLLP